MTRTSTTKLILSSFTYYLGYSSFTTFLSLYLIKVGYVEYEIGFILTYASLTGIIGSYISFLLLEKYSSKKISIIITLLKCFCYFLLGFISYQLGVIILIAILYLLQSIFRSSFGLLFKESSKSGNYNKNQGYLFAIINLGWFFGPFISGIIANNIGISYVFIFSGFITLLSVILIYFTSYKHIKIHKKIICFNKLVIDFFKDIKNLQSYFSTFGISIWFIFIFAFVPIILSERYGLSYSQIGLFIGVMNLGSAIGSVVTGKLLQYVGSYRLLYIGYIMIAILLISNSFYKNLLFIYGISMIGSIIIGILEPLKNIIFFENTQSDTFFPIYVTHIESSEIFGKMILSIGILFFGIQSVFLLSGISILIIVILLLGIFKNRLLNS